MDTMSYKGFKAQVMEAIRLTGDQVHRLPPGTALSVYPVDAFVKAPENWMKGPGVFVVPVRPNRGLWFNWRMNSEVNTGIIPTVKGCNPVTGLQTTGFHLEKYENKCPKHGVKFMAERYCPECKYNWPDRNFISMSPLWWDGFRAEDGTVRQFFFTEDELRDIATHMIGKENTVPAFGFAFYTPKEPRPEMNTIRAFSSGVIVADQCGANDMLLGDNGGGTWMNFMAKGSSSVKAFNNCTNHVYHSSLSYTSSGADGMKLCASNNAPIPCAATPAAGQAVDSDVQISSKIGNKPLKQMQSIRSKKIGKEIKTMGVLHLDSSKSHEYSCDDINTISEEESKAKHSHPTWAKLRRESKPLDAL